MKQIIKMKIKHLILVVRFVFSNLKICVYGRHYFYPLVIEKHSIHKIWSILDLISPLSPHPCPMCALALYVPTQVSMYHCKSAVARMPLTMCPRNILLPIRPYPYTLTQGNMPLLIFSYSRTFAHVSCSCAIVHANMLLLFFF